MKDDEWHKEKIIVHKILETKKQRITILEQTVHGITPTINSALSEISAERDKSIKVASMISGLYENLQTTNVSLMNFLKSFNSQFVGKVSEMENYFDQQLQTAESQMKSLQQSHEDDTKCLQNNYSSNLKTLNYKLGTNENENKALRQQLNISLEKIAQIEEKFMSNFQENDGISNAQKYSL